MTAGVDTRILLHNGPTTSVLARRPLAEADGADCLLHARHSLVSAGTERTVALGRVPADLHASMAVPYMDGTFAFPLSYGYSMVAVVVEGPVDVVGRTVHLMHPHQDRCRVRRDDLYLVPAGVPPRRAALASNLETAVNAVWDGGVGIGDRVLVVGFGLIGALLAAVIAPIPGAAVTVYDVNPAQRVRAAALGHTTADAPEALHDFDVAFNTSAAAAGLQCAVDATGMEGTTVELSWYGDRPATLHLGGTFHSRRKRIISSQVSALPAERARRWDHHRRKATVFDLLHDASFDRLLTDTVAFDDLPAWFDRLRAGTVHPLGCIVDYPV